jgi:ABC-type Fe3+ transport system permease subunit
MKLSNISNSVILALLVVAIGLALGSFGIFVGHMDDAPGAGGLGILLFLGSLWLANRIIRRKP